MAKIMVERINCMASWVRETVIGELKVGYLKKDHHDSFNTTVSRANGKFKDEGEDKWLMYWSNGNQDRVAVFAMTMAEREEIEKDINKRDKYEKKLPKDFHDKTVQWREGSWH